MPRKRVSVFPDITPPELPPLPQLSAVSSLRLKDGGSYTNMLIDTVDLSGQEVEDVLFEQAVCRKVQFNETSLKGSQCLDARFENCALLNAKWEKMH